MVENVEVVSLSATQNRVGEWRRPQTAARELIGSGGIDEEVDVVPRGVSVYLLCLYELQPEIVRFGVE